MSRHKPDVSIVLTAHREGALAGATARSVLKAVAHARASDELACEVVVVLDNASKITKETLQHTFRDADEMLSVRFLETEERDPGQARNRGIAAAVGRYATFIDGDDLWSYNWISEAHRLCTQRPDAVAQSMVNVVFGGQKNLWWHVDSEGPFFDPAYLAWANYWDAMSFARTQVYRELPFRRNDLRLGFGHEDWHWSIQSHTKGLAHKPVPNTVHFKRRRAGSQMSLVDNAGGVVWPDTEVNGEPLHDRSH